MNLTEETRAPLSRPVGEYFRRFYNDTAISYAPDTLKCGVSYFGDDHVLFGTDFPMGSASGEQWTRDILRAIDDAGLSAATRSKILWENADRMLSGA